MGEGRGRGREWVGNRRRTYATGELEMHAKIPKMQQIWHSGTPLAGYRPGHTFS